jgi:pyruvate formate lyase activating enzyme
MKRGVVFNVQRFSLHDGPGIRTSVFLKGCPLACTWCHNPEGRLAAPEILVLEGRCIGCAACVAACELDLARPADQGSGWANGSAACVACGSCVDACPTQTRVMAGREMTVDEVMAEILLDRVFFEESGGGATFTGGEPLKQAEFVLPALGACRDHGIHTAVDTCGMVDREDLLAAAKLADLFLFDIKSMDPDIHRRHTGAGNERILSNLEALGEVHHNIWLRVPLIPGVNDSPHNIRSIRQLADSVRGVTKISLLPYHRLGSDKRMRLDGLDAFAGMEPPSDQRLRELAARLRDGRVPVTIGA